MKTSFNFEKIQPAKSLADLLALDDEEFVTYAYLALLGRAPDPHGFSYYMGRLYRTGDKLAIIYQISKSKEAAQFDGKIKGLQGAIWLYRLRQLPILGAMLKVLAPDSTNQEILNLLRKVNQRVGYLEAKISNAEAYGKDTELNANSAISDLFDSFNAEQYLEDNPDVAASGINPFEHFITSGWQEGRFLPETMQTPVKDVLGQYANFDGNRNSANEASQSHIDNEWLIESHGVNQAAPLIQSSGPSNDKANYFMQPAEEALQGDGYTFTKLMHYIWFSRPDLQKAYDIYSQDGRFEYGKWFLTTASREYGLLPRLYPDDLLQKLIRAGGNIEEQAQSILSAKVKASAGASSNTEAMQVHSDSLGANLIGYAFGEFGMGEHVRMVARSLDATNTSFCILDQDVGTHGANDSSARHWVTDKPRYDINIFHVNADVLPQLFLKFGESLFAGRHNIGYWAWELSKCPPEFDFALGMIDEVWAISDFVAESFKTRSSVPVLTMPLAVTVPNLDSSLYTKKHYGLPEDKFTFFFTFDAASYLDRKNPIAVVKAFKQAFPSKKEKVHLLLKTMNTDAAGPLWSALLKEVGNDPRITVMEKRLDRDEVLGLNLACDAFVSLHRSEGFGRCVAEAMAYGKPVITTNYSGTRDFAKEDTACVVDYKLVPVPDDAYPFWRDQVWAEPSINHATTLMRKLVNDKKFRDSMALAGQKYVLENFNESAIGSKYATQLDSIRAKKLINYLPTKISPSTVEVTSTQIALFTIVSKNYLAYARTLLNSVAKMHPEFKLFLCLVDEIDDCFKPDEELFSIVKADELGIPSFRDMALRYDVMELNTAVKPFMFRWMFNNLNIGAAIYLDPDIRLYSRLDHLIDELNQGASIVLTPHIHRPLEDGKLPDDHSMLEAGVFNLGFMAANNCKESIDYIDWWGRKLLTQAVSDISKNLFTDQKWCDLAPCFLENLKVLKHSGYNVAYWNLAHRNIVKTSNDVFEVNNQPLVFFHFSGINPKSRESVSKHQDRFNWKDISKDCQFLFSQYIDELLRNGWETTSKWTYAYSTVSDSFYVASVIRHLYRATHPKPISLDGVDIEKYLVGLCNQPTRKNDIRITRLMDMIYNLRVDLQNAFNLSSIEGRNQFVEWYRYAAPTEYKLPDSLIN